MKKTIQAASCLLGLSLLLTSCDLAQVESTPTELSIDATPLEESGWMVLQKEAVTVRLAEEKGGCFNMLGQKMDRSVCNTSDTGSNNEIKNALVLYQEGQLMIYELSRNRVTAYIHPARYIKKYLKFQSGRPQVNIKEDIRKVFRRVHLSPVQIVVHRGHNITEEGGVVMEMIEREGSHYIKRADFQLESR